MPKEASNFTDTKILMAERSFPLRRGMPLGDVMNRRSHWPFTVEEGGGDLEMPNADTQSLAHPGTGSFIS